LITNRYLSLILRTGFYRREIQVFRLAYEGGHVLGVSPLGRPEHPWELLKDASWDIKFQRLFIGKVLIPWDYPKIHPHRQGRSCHMHFTLGSIVRSQGIVVRSLGLKKFQGFQVGEVFSPHDFLEFGDAYKGNHALTHFTLGRVTRSPRKPCL